MKKIILLIALIVFTVSLAEAQRAVVRSDSSGDAHGYVTPQALRTAKSVIKDTTDSKVNRSEIPLIEGQLTLSVGDSTQVSINGLTTATGRAIVAYRSETSLIADTVATWQVNTAGKLTIRGKNGKTISYWVTHK